MVSAHSEVALDACYPAQAARVADIRTAVADVAARCGAGHGLLVRIGLAVSEAATNVVVHAYRGAGMPRGLIHVKAACREQRFLDILVRDDGVGMSPRTDSPGLGLGISLMAHEADELEIRVGDEGGTEVQLRFALA
jgi:anti-sigma regulatory factor (Ser/Thr protein kinase)